MCAVRQWSVYSLLGKYSINAIRKHIGTIATYVIPPIYVSALRDA